MKNTGIKPGKNRQYGPQLLIVTIRYLGLIYKAVTNTCIIMRRCCFYESTAIIYKITGPKFFIVSCLKSYLLSDGDKEDQRSEGNGKSCDSLKRCNGGRGEYQITSFCSKVPSLCPCVLIRII